MELTFCLKITFVSPHKHMKYIVAVQVQMLKKFWSYALEVLL